MTEQTTPRVGEYVVSSWGYEQTNIEFYRVERVSSTNVWLQPWTQKLVTTESWGSETVVPGDAPLTGHEWEEVDGVMQSVEGVKKVIRRAWKRMGDSWYVCPRGHDFAKPWDGRAMLQTHWH